MAQEFTARSGQHYKPVRELGQGSFGVVYLVADESQRTFALKLMAAADPQDAASVTQELESTTGLIHDNVLQIVDYGDATVDGGPGFFIVSEYCADGDYRWRLKQLAGKESELETILSDFRQILSGLGALHKRVIHRDLKPENILISGALLKIADFGLARFVDVATRTHTFKGAGTYLYMAPEVWQMKRASCATDLYAIGVMLYEACAGDWPFYGDVNQLRAYHLYAPAPRAKSQQPWIPDLIDGVIKKLLAKEPQDRYQSAEELLSALSAAAPRGVGASVDLADRIRRHYDDEEANQLEKGRAADLGLDSEARMRYKEQELLMLMEESVQEINERLTETKIQVSKGANSCEFRYGDRTLLILFFRKGQMYHDPKAPGRMEVLRKRYLVHGGVIEIKERGHDRQGWNVILVRPPESMYGEWRLVETRHSAVSKVTPGFEPFATEATLLADNLACHWEQARYPFTLTDKVLDRQDLTKIFDFFIP
jgi:serine/threonine protein kinase